MAEKDGKRLWIEDTDLAWDSDPKGNETSWIDYFGFGGYDAFWKEATDDAYYALVGLCVDRFNRDRQEALESRYGIRSEGDWLESDIPWPEVRRFL